MPASTGLVPGSTGLEPGSTGLEPGSTGLEPSAAILAASHRSQAPARVRAGLKPALPGAVPRRRPARLAVC